jgi:hypothetical protein
MTKNHNASRIIVIRYSDFVIISGPCSLFFPGRLPPCVSLSGLDKMRYDDIEETMPLSASAGGEHGLGDNDDEASLWEVLMVLGVVASRFFYAPCVNAPR